MTHLDSAASTSAMRAEDLGGLTAWVSWVHTVRQPCEPSVLSPRRAPLPLSMGEIGGPFRQVTAATFGEVELMPGWVSLRPPGVGAVAVPMEQLPDDTSAALAVGARAADSAIDAGADLVVPVLTQLGPDTHTAAAAAIATLVPQEPAWVLGFERRTPPEFTGYPETCYLDDAGWMRRCRAVRDLSWRVRDLRGEPLLEELHEPVFSVLVGLLLQLADRETPVLLDGPVTAAAALAATRINLFAADYYYAPHRHGDPAERYALDSMGLEPVAALGIRLGNGAGALALLPLLQSVLAAH
ncbi:MAG: nicotinate-nucleotide--dimethylbenzimidazole phosphoribosyltransferase [Mycobacteriales bacterium]